MKRNNYYKATIALGAALVGFLGSYPFHMTFAGGLLSSGFSAALIGGLADWFAVTALFRRPLGIRPGRLIRTEIVPRNRERIFSALAGMVQDELLTPAILKRELESYDLSLLLIRYLDNHEGQAQIHAAVAAITRDLLMKTEPEAFGKLLKELLKHNASELDIIPLVVHAVEFSLSQGYNDKIIDFLVDELLVLANHSQMEALLQHVIRQAKEVYEQGMDRRKLVNAFLIDPPALAELAQKKLIQYLEEIRFKPSHPVREKITLRIRLLAAELQTDSRVKQKLDAWKEAVLANLPVDEYVVEYLKHQGYAESAEASWLIRRITSQLDSLLAGFKQNLGQQGKLDRFLKEWIKNWIDAKHSAIGSIVKESLDRLSNEKLVDLLEEKAGNDLQIIRINGTVVGGLVGMLIYLLTFWLS